MLEQPATERRTGADRRTTDRARIILGTASPLVASGIAAFIADPAVEIVASVEIAASAAASTAAASKDRPKSNSKS